MSSTIREPTREEIWAYARDTGQGYRLVARHYGISEDRARYAIRKGRGEELTRNKGRRRTPTPAAVLEQLELQAVEDLRDLRVIYDDDERAAIMLALAERAVLALQRDLATPGRATKDAAIVVGILLDKFPELKGREQGAEGYDDDWLDDLEKRLQRTRPAPA